MPALQLETNAVVAALKGVTTSRKALEAFLRTLIAFHPRPWPLSADLSGAQFDSQLWQVAELPDVTDSIHVITGQMYGALEAVLAQSPDLAIRGSARTTAVATHMAAIGALSMLSLVDAVHDPMARASDSLIDAMVAIATGRVLRAR